MMPHHFGKGISKMGYFLTFLAGMGFAALIDLTSQLIRRRMNAASEYAATRVVEKVFALDPKKVGEDQMARLRDKMGL